MKTITKKGGKRPGMAGKNGRGGGAGRSAGAGRGAGGTFNSA